MPDFPADLNGKVGARACRDGFCRMRSAVPPSPRLHTHQRPQRKDETSTWLELRLPQAGKRRRVRAKITPGLALGVRRDLHCNLSRTGRHRTLCRQAGEAASHAPKLSGAFQVHSGKPVQSWVLYSAVSVAAFAVSGKIIRINRHRQH